MTQGRPVPDIVVGRLPVYLRALEHMLDQGHRVTSSQMLATRLGIGSAQIRKDLSLFGEFGKQGMGYDVQFLRDQLRSILKADRVWNMVVVGAGDLGHAIVRYGGFEGSNCHVVCVYDNNPQKIGRRLAGLEICDSARLVEGVQELAVKVAIVAVPASAAQAVVDELVRGGVTAILNYAPISVKVPPGVHVQYIDPIIHLQRMTYYL